MFASTGTAVRTTPVCAYCGRPVLTNVVYGCSGEPYHFACTQPPVEIPEPRSWGAPVMCPPWTNMQSEEG